MKRAGLVCVGVALAISGPGAADPGAEPGWTVLRQEDGVVVSRRNGTAGELPVVRATTTLEAGLLETLAVLRDDERRPEWMARCVEARLLERQDRWRSINYSRMSAWPFQDRDVVVATRASIGSGGDTALVQMQSIDSDLARPVDGVVRMPELIGHYRLEAEGEARTRLEYQLATDFGGRLPRRIARRSLEKSAFDTVRNLRDHVPGVRASYAELVAGWAAELPGSIDGTAREDDFSRQSD